MHHQRLRILYYAINSRLVLILWAALSKVINTSYDSSASILALNCTNTIISAGDGGGAGAGAAAAAAADCIILPDHTVNSHTWDRNASSLFYYGTMIITTALGENWDSVYFSRIAVFGYEFEQYFAFFPFVPFLARWTAMVLNFWNSTNALKSWALGLADCETSTGYDIENALHQVSFAGILVSNISFVLAALILYDLSCKELNDRETAYRASLLFCFTPASVFMSAFYTEAPFALFSFAGMLVLSKSNRDSLSLSRALVAAFLFALATGTRANGVVLVGYLGFNLLFPFIQGRHLPSVSAISTAVFKCLLSMLICVTPMALFLYYAFSRFCGTDFQPTWCLDAVPNIYAYVQKAYWGNGFLMYWQVKQIPNFILAFPMAIVSVSTVYAYFFTVWKEYRTTKRISKEQERLLPYVVHLAFLFLMAVFFMHVQVLTRFLSACPPIYWHVAKLTQSASHIVSRAVYIYFAGFFLLGTTLFCNFYPWS